MAVAYPSQTPHATVYGTPGSPPYTGSYAPPSGANRQTFFMVGFGASTGNGTASSLTWGGQTGTKIGTLVTDSNWPSQDVFRFTEAQIAAKSDDNYSVATSGANQAVILAFTLTGVDQTTPVSGTQTGSGTGTTAQASASVTTTSDGMAVACLFSDDQAINTSSAHSHTSITYTGVAGSDTIGSAQRTAGTGGSINLTWTQASTGYTVKAFNVNAVAAAASPLTSKNDNNTLRPFNMGSGRR